MPIDLSKQHQASGLEVVAIEALGAGARGAPSLVALALDAHGSTTSGGVVYHARAAIFDNALRFVADGRPAGSAALADTIEAFLEKLPAPVRAVVLYLAYDGGTSGSPSIRVDVQIRVFEVVQGIEILRRRIVTTPGSIHEIGRLERDAAKWRFVEDDRVHQGFLSELVTSGEDRVRPREAASATSSSPLDGVAVDTGSGYCDVATRRSLVARATSTGLPPDEAEIMVDIELDRLRVANEAVLLERLESVLRRFTDEDARLDDKERRDALQIVCRPSPGYVHGLRHDVADGYVVQFCRERRVKIKMGLLRWAVP